MGEDFHLASFLAQTSHFQLCGFFFTFLGWLLCFFATSLGQWRQWRIENTTKFQSGVMWIGIWDVCYDTTASDADYSEINCKQFDAEHIFLPTEIFIAQDLMSLCAVVETIALGFLIFGFWNIIKKENKKGISFTSFCIGGFLSIASGAVVLIPVIWNMFSVLNNNRINFPESFGMPSEPKDQYIGAGVHLGFVSAVLQIVSGLLFLGDNCLMIHKRTHPLDSEGSEFSSGKDSENCPPGSSSQNVATSDHKRLNKPDMSFHIPMGPIPDQRIARSNSKAFSSVVDVAYF